MLGWCDMYILLHPRYEVTMLDTHNWLLFYLEDPDGGDGGDGGDGSTAEPPPPPPPDPPGGG